MVARFARTLVVLNRYPYDDGHVSVVTLRHERQLESLEQKIARSSQR